MKNTEKWEIYNRQHKKNREAINKLKNDIKIIENENQQYKITLSVLTILIYCVLVILSVNFASSIDNWLTDICRISFVYDIAIITTSHKDKSYFKLKPNLILALIHALMWLVHLKYNMSYGFVFSVLSAYIVYIDFSKEVTNLLAIIKFNRKEM